MSSAEREWFPSVEAPVALFHHQLSLHLCKLVVKMFVKAKIVSVAKYFGEFTMAFELLSLH